MGCVEKRNPTELSAARHDPEEQRPKRRQTQASSKEKNFSTHGRLDRPPLAERTAQKQGIPRPQIFHPHRRRPQGVGQDPIASGITTDRCGDPLLPLPFEKIELTGRETDRFPVDGNTFDRESSPRFLSHVADHERPAGRFLATHFHHPAVTGIRP